MKKLLLGIGFLGIFATVATAGFKVPRHVHEDLKAAQKEALEESKPLAFIYTDPGSS